MLPKQIGAGMIWIYRLLLAALVLAIFFTAVSIARETQARHDAYIELRQLSSDLTTMRIEQQRLLIEQQTFSATPQVAKRAVSELGMFFPTDKNRRIITPTATKPNNDTQTEKQVDK